MLIPYNLQPVTRTAVATHRVVAWHHRTNSMFMVWQRLVTDMEDRLDWYWTRGLGSAALHALTYQAPQNADPV